MTHDSAQQLTDDFHAAAELWRARRVHEASNRLLPDTVTDSDAAHDRIHCLAVTGGYILGAEARKHLPTPPAGGFYGLVIDHPDRVAPDQLLAAQLTIAGANEDEPNLRGLVGAACNPDNGDQLLLFTIVQLVRLYTHLTTPKDTPWARPYKPRHPRWRRYWTS